MPKRNVVVLVVACLVCLAAYVVRERSAPGRRFGEILSLIDASSLDRVDGERLFQAAVDAAVSQLDEHSAYIHGDERASLEAALDQEFGGVGLELMAERGSRQPIVASPVIDSPAWRAGIRAGDRLEAIDGEPTQGMEFRRVVDRLRGTVGEPVVVRVATVPAEIPTTRDPGVSPRDAETRRDVTLVREVIRTESVLGDRRRPDGDWEWMLDGEPGVALVRITMFGERTVDELRSAAAAIAASGDTRGVVLDLRGNPGGLLSAAVDVCDLFLDDGVIVHTRGRPQAGTPADAARLESRRATSGAVLGGVPIVVLIDGLTASAAEVVAACLQDAGRAVVVGSRSFGKGTVQSILPLADDHGLLKLTTSEYLRPDRSTIHRRIGDGDTATWGVSPDAGFEVAPTAESLARLAAWRRVRDVAGPAPVDWSSPGLPRGEDPVLARGLEALSGPAGGAGGKPDLGGEEETPGHDDQPAPPDA